MESAKEKPVEPKKLYTRLKFFFRRRQTAVIPKSIAARLALNREVDCPYNPRRPSLTPSLCPRETSTSSSDSCYCTLLCDGTPNSHIDSSFFSATPSLFNMSWRKHRRPGEGFLYRRAKSRAEESPLPIDGRNSERKVAEKSMVDLASVGEKTVYDYLSTAASKTKVQVERKVNPKKIRLLPEAYKDIPTVQGKNAPSRRQGAVEVRLADFGESFRRIARFNVVNPFNAYFS